MRFCHLPSSSTELLFLLVPARLALNKLINIYLPTASTGEFSRYQIPIARKYVKTNFILIFVSTSDQELKGFGLCYMMFAMYGEFPKMYEVLRKER